MAASVYATPPPDLSGEDTVLSDISNASSSQVHSTNGTLTMTPTVNCKATNSPIDEMQQQSEVLDRPQTTTFVHHSPNSITNNSCNSSSSSSSVKEDSEAVNGTKETHSVSNSNCVDDSVSDKPNPSRNNSIRDVISLTSSVVSNMTNQNSDDNSIYSNIISNSISNFIDNAGLLPALMGGMGSPNDQMEMPDLSKKRRKQTMPIRISNSNPLGSIDTSAGPIKSSNNDKNNTEGNEDEIIGNQPELQHLQKLIEKESDAEKLKLLETNILLRQKLENNEDGLDIVKKAALLFSHLQKTQNSNRKSSESETENYAPFMVETEMKSSKSIAEGNLDENQNEDDKGKSRSPFENNNLNLLLNELNYNSDCGDCGMKFDSEFKLRLHMIQEHGQLAQKFQFQSNVDKSDMKLHSEDHMDSERMNNHLLMAQLQQQQLGSGNKPEDWLSLPGLPFPFPPEAAAALSASGYLPQLPLLGMPSQLSQFQAGNPQNPSMDGLSRSNGPPLRIFNPEAYCDLCNKEFCNKYFLKTHRANKHGIYENASSGDSVNSTQPGPSQSQNLVQPHQQPNNNMSHLLNPQTSPQPMLAGNNSANISNPTTSDTSVHCDICFKKFTNLFTMRRHRSKVHDTVQISNTEKSESQQTLNQEMINPEPERLTPIRFPDDFRQDFTVEQEDANFTPQPRKLSPVSSQQARESNFSVDKLKRLGVLNPEAFCELCCKEYCNKYFLRTHKLKRHGIFMPPDDIKELVNDRNPNPWQYVQTSPLNLIMSGHPDFGQMQQHLHQKFLNEMNDLANRNQVSKSPVDMIKQDRNEEGNNDNKDDPAKNESKDEKFNEKENSVSESENKMHQDTDAISMDLQKLQSMILQLNDLNANQQRPITCNLCGKELGNQYLLHAHMISEHGHMPENLLNLKNLSPSSSPVQIPNQFSQLQQQLLGNLPTEFCKQCDKEFPNAVEFKAHLTEVHGENEISESISPTREGFVTPDRPIGGINGSGNQMPTTPSGDRRPPYTMTPTSSYCEICNKELCNKYFMKTHMQRMHGIEIENGSQIGGVVCNICNKELCSKYFLRVHKHNTHGIVEEGSPLPPAAIRANGESSQDNSGSDNIFPPLDLPLKPTDLADLSSRYFNHFTEVCPLCTRRFRSAKWLKAHLMSDHGKIGVDKLKELEQQLNMNKSNHSPTLKIPNGGNFGFNNSTSPEPNLMKSSLSNILANNSSSDPEELNNNSNRMKEYQCSFCPFSTPYYAFLFIHERSHSLMNPNMPASAHAHSSSPIMSPLNSMGEPLNMKENIKNLQLQTAFSNQSELAVSIAKDLYPGSNHNQPPAATSASTSEFATPSSTPASTPGVVVSAADSKHTMDVDQNEEVKEEDLSTKKKPKNPLRSDGFLNRLSGVDVIPMAKLSRMESCNMLKEMANLTRRPAIYALPKDSEPMIMQSFLIEEAKGRGQKRKAVEISPDFGHDFLDLCQGGELTPFGGNHHQLQQQSAPLHHPLHPAEGKSRKRTDDSSPKNRFVPAVVFLPVRERISTPVTISFTLTPA